MTNPTTSTQNSRRTFLALAGGTVASAAFLGACAAEPHANSSGTVAPTSVPPTAPPVTASADDKAADVKLLQTAISLENSIVAAYKKLVADKRLTEAKVKTWLTKLSDNHTAYSRQLNAMVTELGGDGYEKTNPSVDSNLVTPAIKTAANNADLLALAVTLETAAFSTLALELASLNVTENHHGVMAIAAAEARNASALTLLGNPASRLDGAPDAFVPARNALGADAEVK